MEHPNRRQVLAGLTVASATATMAGVAIAAEHPDARIREVARKWHELQAQIRPLLRERERLKHQIPALFRQLIPIDPRACKPDPVLYGELAALLPIYEPLYIGLGLGDINDRLGALWDAQNPCAEYLVNEAEPRTLKGAIALASVALADLSADHLLDDPVRDHGNDWDVKVAVAGRDALAFAARLVREA